MAKLRVKAKKAKKAKKTLGRIVTHRRYTHSLHAASLDAMKKRAKPDVRERFGFAVKSGRETLDLTQEEFADRARIHRTYLSDVERGTRNISLINIERIAKALAVPMAELFRLVD
jgi:ribosome-binding protein aMBF1 (putative translation factor)